MSPGHEPSPSAMTRRCNAFARGSVWAQVIMFNPGFLWYLTMIRLVGATPVMVKLEGPDFAPDLAKV